MAEVKRLTQVNQGLETLVEGTRNQARNDLAKVRTDHRSLMERQKQEATQAEASLKGDRDQARKALLGIQCGWLSEQ